MLTVRDLQVYYGGIKAVDGVSFCVGAGETFGVVGESGSGKSTLGRAVLGLEGVRGGKIFFGDVNVTGGLGRNRSWYRRNVQMIFQDVFAALNPRKRVRDIVAEPLRNFCRLSRAEEVRRVAELLDMVGLRADAAAKYPFEFSGGQRQRVGVARAIALGPRLIVADEPVSALDVSVQAQVLNCLKNVQRQLGVSILFISHDMSVVRHMCPRLAIMHRGRFVEVGSRADIFENPRHIYTQRLITAIPETDPTKRGQALQRRATIEAAYRQEIPSCYDTNGRVLDLRRVGAGHLAAVGCETGPWALLTPTNFFGKKFDKKL